MRIIVFISLFIVTSSLTLFGQDFAYPNQYNIVWDTPSENASGSMPVGGGDIGLNVWVEKNELFLYAQRSGVHDEYNGFPKLGRVRVTTEPNILDGSTSFRQELILKESAIEISVDHPVHGAVKFKIWVEVNRPKVHIAGEADKKLTFFAQYESWRTEPRALSMDADSQERWGWWDTGAWPHEVILEPDHFKQEPDGLYFYHINPEEKLTSKLSYKLLGLEEYYGQYYDPLKDLVWGGYLGGTNVEFDGTSQGRYHSTDFTAWRYKSAKPLKQQEFTLQFHTSRCGTGDKWLEEIEAVKKENKGSTQKAWAENQQWWKGFWERSYIILNPEKDASDSVWRVGRNYNLFRYMTALNSHGENPTMFNGGLLSVDPGLITAKSDYHPDWRRWSGGNYTMQNQRWVYWPMLKWGDFSHMESQFDFFLRVLEIATLRVAKHYGHAGCKFDETGTVYGLSMPMIYGFDSTDTEMRKRQPWMDPGLTSNWSVAHHHTAMLEFSHMIIEYHRYSGRDISKWLPFVKGTLDFFDNYYRTKAKYNANFKEHDPDGKLILFPASACESHYFVSNPVPDVAGLKAVVQGALNLPQEWVDEFFGGQEDLNRLQATLPDIHLDTIKGETVIPPGKSVVYSWWPKTELYINYPMFPFNLIEIGDKEMEYVHNTYKHWTIWQTPRAWEIPDSWANANVAFARMGLTDKAADLTYKTLEDGPFRFPSFWGPGFDWVPDHNWGGTGSVGLQEMLVQTLDDKIVLLPSWPPSWDGDFKVHCPKSTVVSGKIRDGKVQSLQVFPEERRSDIIIRE